MQNIQIFHFFQTTTKNKHPFPSVLWLFKDMQSTNYEGHEDRSTFWKRSMPSCKINITSFHRVPSVWIDKDKQCLRHTNGRMRMILIGKVKPYFLHIFATILALNGLGLDCKYQDTLKHKVRPLRYILKSSNDNYTIFFFFASSLLISRAIFYK